MRFTDRNIDEIQGIFADNEVSVTSSYVSQYDDLELVVENNLFLSFEDFQNSCRSACDDCVNLGNAMDWDILSINKDVATVALY